MVRNGLKRGLSIGGVVCLFGASLGSAQAQQEIKLFDEPAGKSKKQPATKGTPSNIKIESQPGVSASNAGQETQIKFKRRGLSMFAAARVHGKKVYFLVDTGASMTTLTPGFAKKLGILPGAKAPSVVVNTANGQRKTRYGLMTTLSLGDRPHYYVSFTLCASCGAKRTPWGAPLVGLLGMNVLRRYEMKIDEARGLITLTPGLGYQDRWPDIQPWMALVTHGVKPRKRGKGFEYHATVKNRSRAMIKGLRFELTCTDSKRKKLISLKSKTTTLRAGQSKTLRATNKHWCQPKNFRFVEASW